MNRKSKAPGTSRSSARRQTKGPVARTDTNPTGYLSALGKLEVATGKSCRAADGKARADHMMVAFGIVAILAANLVRNGSLSSPILQRDLRRYAEAYRPKSPRRAALYHLVNEALDEIVQAVR